MSHNIAIAVCTFRRPLMLLRCLEEMTKLQVPPGCRIHLVVVDNAPEQSAKDTVQRIQETSVHQITYLHAQRRGIPCARNKALEFVLPRDFDFLAFIDDDEYPKSDWLIQMIGCAERFHEPVVVHGNVIPECPEGAPGYLLPFFRGRTGKPTGTSLGTCATDNVLVPVEPLRLHQLLFDESRPLAGGTDTDFFCRAAEKGLKIISCAEAVVYETVPLERISVRWLAKRKFRVGINVGKRKLQKRKFRIFYMLLLLPRVVWKLFTALFFLLAFQRRLGAREYIAGCRYAGMIWGLLGFSMDAYGSVDGY